MKTISLTCPLTKEKLKELRIGDIVELSGEVYTCRDAGHQRIREAVSKGDPPPVDLDNAVIYYAGPTPAAPGRVIGSIAPTTSIRIDPFVEMMFELGMSAMIGKGERTQEVLDACKKYGGVYFVGVGGAAAIGSRSVKAMEVLAYDDLGPESIKRLTLEKMRVVVAIDSEGNDFFAEQRAIYQK